MGEISVKRTDSGSFSIDIRGHELAVDERREDMTDEDGPTPVEMFVASLAACTATLAASYLTRHGHPVEDLTLETVFTMTDDPRRVGTVKMLISTPQMSDEQSARMLKVVERCTVHNSLMNPPDIDIVLS